MRSPELLELAVSPWSAKVKLSKVIVTAVRLRSKQYLQARLALRHCAVQYRTTQFLPGLGEWWIRVRLHKLRGRISAPILFLPVGGANVTGASCLNVHKPPKNTGACSCKHSLTQFVLLDRTGRHIVHVLSGSAVCSHIGHVATTVHASDSMSMCSCCSAQYHVGFEQHMQGQWRIRLPLRSGQTSKTVGKMKIFFHLNWQVRS